MRLLSFVCAFVLLLPGFGSAQTTALFFDSQPGDYIGQGQQRTYTPADGTFSIQRNFDAGVSVDVRGPNFSFWWNLDFASWETPLAVGTYVGARRFPFTRLVGVNISGSGRGCNRETGWYQILEVVYAPDGSVVRFAADFEQHCENFVPALFGSIRYNSTISTLVPFGGQYPRYVLQFTPPEHGTIAATGIACGGGQQTCELTLDAAARVNFTATPDAGYTFVGWTGDCFGAEATSIYVHGPKRCAALFEPASPTSPRTLLRWNSDPGDYIGQGLREVYSSANSLWTVSSSSDRSVTLQVDGMAEASDSYWTLNFAAGAGDTLRAGTRYSTTAMLGTNPATISIYGNGRGCTGIGEFTVRELLRQGTTVVRLAIDFEQRCDTSTAAPLRGSLQYQSTVDMTRLAADRTRLAFGGASNSAGLLVAKTSAQFVRLTQTGTSNLAWTAVASQPWLEVSPPSGTGPGTLRVSIKDGVAFGTSGTFDATVTVSAPGNSEPIAPIAVSLAVSLVGSSAPPIGSLDTPANNSTGLTGSIAVSGWALDNVEVARVELWRQAHPGDPAAAIYDGKVFIGHGSFVEGARPDVEAAYANVPLARRAGWGYLLLTRGMIWDGGGPFVLYAYAVDREGGATLIGANTISINNAAATKPFGTIDTPSQGGTAAGSYAVTGWVLTPNAGATIPAGNVLVAIDGVFLSGIPSMSARADITAAFPSFDTSTAGRGLFVDTSTFLDGLHTIGWYVSDTTNQAEGIGSRFFTIANGANAVAAVTAPAAHAVCSSPRAAATTHVVQASELQRIEVQLPDAGADLTGFEIVGNEQRPLPVGSHLDATRGVFTWQPGPGFLGSYAFTFMRCGVRHDVRVVLHPQHAFTTTQVVVDTPGPLQRVDGAFLVAGWALDPQAHDAPGIDVVHVWAYPEASAFPLFLGSAALGGVRPDVAEIYGDAFTSAGYGLRVNGLAPGRYVLAVFARRTNGEFLPARTVPVTVVAR